MQLDSELELGADQLEHQEVGKSIDLLITEEKSNIRVFLGVHDDVSVQERDGHCDEVELHSWESLREGERKQIKDVEDVLKVADHASPPTLGLVDGD